MFSVEPLLVRKPLSVEASVVLEVSGMLELLKFMLLSEDNVLTRIGSLCLGICCGVEELKNGNFIGTILGTVEDINGYLDVVSKVHMKVTLLLWFLLDAAEGGVASISML